jgi:hypothetical protein
VTAHDQKDVGEVNGSHLAQQADRSDPGGPPTPSERSTVVLELVQLGIDADVADDLVVIFTHGMKPFAALRELMRLQTVDVNQAKEFLRRHGWYPKAKEQTP